MPNNSNTLAIITSYPAKNGEIAVANAISRYSYLLSRSFPKTQKLVVFCEKNKKNTISYQPAGNILVVPTYKFNSFGFFNQVLEKAVEFNRVKDYLIQFEFSIFGGKKVIPSFLFLLLCLKVLGKNTTITLHQVATNLNELSGHLGLKRNSLETRFLNLSLSIFYRTIGMLVQKIIVHDNLLKNRLSEYVSSNKIEVIPHAIGDESVRKITPRLVKATRKEFGFVSDDKVIAVYGYRSWYKGTDWIVKTIKELSGNKKYKNLKLLVAGGVSPTLKDTNSYKNFDRKLKNKIKKANGSVKVTGFVPEKDVWKIFATSDVVVFPYRTRMSASGAFSLALAYKKPFLVSSHFAIGSDIDLTNNIFELNAFSFENALLNVKKVNTQDIVESRSWRSIANLYIDVVKSVRINCYANVFSKNTFQLAES